MKSSDPKFNDRRTPWVMGLIALGVIGLSSIRVDFNRSERNQVNGQPDPLSDEINIAAEAVKTPARWDEVEPPHQSLDKEMWTIMARPAIADLIEAEVAAPAGAFHYVALEEALGMGKQSLFARVDPGRVVLPLPDGRRLDAVMSSGRSSGPGRYTSEGQLLDVPGSRVVMAYVRGRVSASIEGVAPGEIKLRTLDTVEGPVMQMYAVDPSLVPDCGTGPAVEASKRDGQASLNFPSIPQAAELRTSGDAEIHLLVAYTSAVTAALGGTDNVLAEIDLAVTKVNSDLARSGLTARIKLVDTLEVTYPGDNEPGGVGGWQNTMLERAVGITDGFMDELHARRDAVGADMVTVVQRRGDSTSSGIAYVLNEMGHFREPYYSFSVVNFASFSDSTLLTHELGHNLGCAHARKEAFEASPSPIAGYHGAYVHSYGFRITAPTSTGSSREIRSIMAYSPGTRVPYFSGPNISIPTFLSGGSMVTFAQPVTLGLAEGDGVESADNVRTIERTAFQVAGYRMSPNAANVGRLVNVSTRAFVGSGYQTLTGGFVITGPGSKRVLVRAPGPTIGASPFNVPGALENSFLRINSIGAGLAGENDDWNLPVSNGVEVAATGQQVGAFTFANGSLDAALVLDLEPGAYTAEVTGAAGTEGVALIEAYEVSGPESARVVNLSTRAFASTERPIIAGFVVEADPGKAGAPKSMFIRVRGPSLVTYGLPEEMIMPDPTIEIYDADAQLVYFNDDWDSPSTDLDGSSRNTLPILSRGTVDQLSEQQVFDAAQAVGVADMMPTEPGVVLEMPPGIYTVMVRPFEAMPSQPAIPGVAIIEVYEIAGRP